MRIRRVLFFTLFMILCMGMLNSCFGEDSSNNNLDFTYEGISYNVNVEQIAKEKNINLENYPYYLIAKEKRKSYISIYYSQKRITTMFDSMYNCYRVYGSKSTLKIE